MTKTLFVRRTSGEEFDQFMLRACKTAKDAAEDGMEVVVEVEQDGMTLHEMVSSSDTPETVADRLNQAYLKASDQSPPTSQAQPMPWPMQSALARKVVIAKMQSIAKEMIYDHMRDSLRHAVMKQSIGANTVAQLRAAGVPENEAAQMTQGILGIGDVSDHVDPALIRAFESAIAYLEAVNE